jgi:glycosyltransferase involved in cell wall biosynthesis
MRVLFVSNHLPPHLPTATQGIYKRMGLFMDALKPIAQLEMLFFVAPDADTSAETIARLEADISQHWNVKTKLTLCPTPAQTPSKFQQQIAGIFNFHHQADYIGTSHPAVVQAFEQCLDRNPDALFIHRLNSLCPAMLSDRPLPPIFFDLDDVEHIKFIRQLRQPPTRVRTLLYYLQVPARLRGELRAIRLTRQTFVCSDHDRRYLLNRWGLSNVVSVPNAIKIPSPQPLTPQPTLLLLGGYYYFPNTNAANFLIEQVLPRIQRVIPNAHLIIAGPKPEAIRSYAKKPTGVEFTGFVEDLDALYQRSRVVCCPIFSGGGTRVKMIEAAAYGKPIVSTRIGAEGLEMTDGKDFLLRDRPQDFADACIELLQNDGLCDRLGAAARNTAIQSYDRANIVQLIRHQISSATQVPTQGQTYVSPV